MSSQTSFDLLINQAKLGAFMMLGVLVLIILALIGFQYWVFMKKFRNRKRSLKVKVFLKIQIPEDNEIEPAAAEQMYSSFYGIRKSGFWESLNEQDHISFEIVGTKNGVTLIDDYAHHPTAVKETLNAAKLKYPNSKIWAVFEPHTFSRTQATLKELATSFDSADQVLISEIYPARENIKEATISSEQVINEIRGNALKLKSADSVRLVHNKSEALEILKNELKPTDVVVVMAVGDFNRLAYELKEAL
jgi:UDP-N-acetylmuramate--alanine ligase